MGNSHRLGEWGENVARVFLELCGYRCVEQRYRRPGGEIDLIMRKGSILVFVEVKTRRSNALAPAEAWVGAGQRRRLRRLAGQWLGEHAGQAPGELRFDVVAVEIADQDDGASIRHLAGVF